MEPATKKYLDKKFAEIHDRFTALEKLWELPPAKAAEVQASQMVVPQTSLKAPVRPGTDLFPPGSPYHQKSWPGGRSVDETQDKFASRSMTETQQNDASHSTGETQQSGASQRYPETHNKIATPQQFAAQQYQQMKEKPPDFLLLDEDPWKQPEIPVPKEPPYDLQVTPEEYQQIQRIRQERLAPKKPRNTGVKLS